MAPVLARGRPEWLPYAASLPLLTIPIYIYEGLVGALVSLPLLTIPVLLLVFFFRDPERSVGDGVVSPADGRVLEVADDGERIRISIYMGPLDVHVNRSPVEGRIASIRHFEGGHRLAFSKDSPLNERVVWTIESPLGEVELVQIAGAFARRIVPYLKEGERVQKGERIGLIRFGSRVDLSLPRLPTLSPRVKVGDRVRAAATTLLEVSRC